MALTESNGNRGRRSTTGSVRIGWKYFVTPFAAADVALQGARFTGSTETYAALSASLQPYAFGRASGYRAAPQETGAMDVSLSAIANLSPETSYGVTVGVAPFFASVLQIGGELTEAYQPARERRPSFE